MWVNLSYIVSALSTSMAPNRHIYIKNMTLHLRILTTCMLLCMLVSKLHAQESPILQRTLSHAFKQLDRTSEWKQVASIDIQFDTFHPQGFALLNDHLFISSVEIRERTRRYKSPQNGLDRTPGKGKGHIFKIDLAGNLIAHTEIGTGDMYHPGGIDFDGSEVWIPVAEYRPDSRSVIYSMHPDSLIPKERFRMRDHIGGVISDTDNNTLHAVSWGSRRYYSWKVGDLPKNIEQDIVGRLNPAHYIDYQDCQYAGGHTAICSGLAGYYQAETQQHFALGGLELIDLKASRPIHQIPFPFWTSSGLPMTQNPVVLQHVGGVLRLYAMPEDNQSRLYIYEVSVAE